MTTEREYFSSTTPTLVPTEYVIAGNPIRAYRDGDGNLVCVIDYAILPDKPNVLLIIDRHGDRKWDDVLANDYNMDLETIRPKRDNKYQKLDIEYGGLNVYDELIAAYESNIDLDDALESLATFRHTAVRTAAMDRLAAAEIITENARETIMRARETIAELNGRVRQLRTKLGTERKSIGHEPNRQSASKIVRLEAQIDTTTEKLTRARRRMRNAEKRLSAAEQDAETARDLLNIIGHGKSLSHAATRTTTTAANNTAPTFTQIINSDTTDTFTESDEPEPQGDEIMADNDSVEPLFDTNPEILDEEIAFKPVEFNSPQIPEPVAAPNNTPATETMHPNTDSEPITPTPLSFAPPSDTAVPQTPAAPQPTAPVLNTMRPVDSDNAPMAAAPVAAAPIMPTPIVTPTAAPAPRPVTPVTPVARPVSPITGNSVTTNVGETPHKPTLIYYILLIILIVMSIFTLWLYQRSTNDTVPDITTTTDTETAAPAPTPDVDGPFIATAPEPTVVAPEPEPVTVVEPEPEPAPVVATPEPEPVAAPVAEQTPLVITEPEPEPAPVVATDSETPFITEPVPEPEPILDRVVNKPVYNAASQNDDMFVAAPDYDNTPPAAIANNVVTNNTPFVETNDDIPMCSDGNAPDVHGCCTGEEFADLGVDGFACCVIGTDECFPPME